jgi:mannose-6-phosphate isomerase-like protein (cupin superfamily)
MGFVPKVVKGLNRCLVDEALGEGPLSVHISQIAPGTRAHPPHTHAGVEGFYVLEGHGTVEVNGASAELGPNDLVLVDASRMHGLVNTGDVDLRYMVIISRTA